MKNIEIYGASEHNLKQVDVKIPKNKLTVITGVSGSGKSSLAFSTIYAEGQRRYLESLSSYAKQFMSISEKPKVDKIIGLTPSICIDQQSANYNPRSTVATVTEIYDYLRLLFANIGVAYCPKCGDKVTAQTIDQIRDNILKNHLKSKVFLTALLVIDKKGEFKELFASLAKEGFMRVLVDDIVYRLDEEIDLDKNIKHTIKLVVDRLIITDDKKTRLNNSLETANTKSNGKITLEILNDKNQVEKTIDYSTKLACLKDELSFDEIEPRLFSFNSPIGSCLACHGIGSRLSVVKELLIYDENLTINQGALNPSVISSWNSPQALIKAACKYFEIPVNVAFKDLTKEQQDILLYGAKHSAKIKVTYKGFSGKTRTYNESFRGLVNYFNKRYYKSDSSFIQDKLKPLMVEITCNECNGSRLNSYVNSIKIDLNSKANKETNSKKLENNKEANNIQYNINDLALMSIHDLLETNKIIRNNLNDYELELTDRIFNELNERLEFLDKVGVGYLNLNRITNSLSGGELQRIRLASGIGNALSGATYVLDEPSIGLHQSDHNKLISVLEDLIKLDNTVIVVEHDLETQRQADYIVELGKYAGKNGGDVVFQGTFDKLAKAKNSMTANYILGKDYVELREPRELDFNKTLEIIGAAENNLNDINAIIPLNGFVTITGVSGSGKSTLINSILYKALDKKINKHSVIPGKHKEIKGTEFIDKIIDIDQTPIGRNPKSNPATYTKVFDHIRDLFASLPEAKARGYNKGRFSFNVKNNGRCENCSGDGYVQKDMLFLPPVNLTCDICNGSRYKTSTLEIKFKEYSIADILALPIDEALELFKDFRPIKRKLQTLVDVGLGYLSLGQSATTLSGGEAQRLKLATELQKVPKNSTLYILDEPTVGLSIYDVKILLKSLQKLVDLGHTVLVIEHNLDIIKQSDYIIDLGPYGGNKGGEIVAAGTPYEIAKTNTLTAQFLKPEIELTKRYMSK